MKQRSEREREMGKKRKRRNKEMRDMKEYRCGTVM